MIGWGWAGSYQVARKGYVNSESSQNSIHWYHFHLHKSHKAAKSMAKLISRSCGESQLVVCLSRGDVAIWRLPRRALEDVWQASETSHSKSNLGKFQDQYLVELLVNMYSYHLMVKCVSCWYVCGSRLFSDPVTYSIIRRGFTVSLTLVHDRLTFLAKSKNLDE